MSEHAATAAPTLPTILPRTEYLRTRPGKPVRRQNIAFAKGGSFDVCTQTDGKKVIVVDKQPNDEQRAEIEQWVVREVMRLTTRAERELTEPATVPTPPATSATLATPAE